MAKIGKLTIAAGLVSGAFFVNAWTHAEVTSAQRVCNSMSSEGMRTQCFKSLSGGKYDDTLANDCRFDQDYLHPSDNDKMKCLSVMRNMYWTPGHKLDSTNAADRALMDQATFDYGAFTMGCVRLATVSARNTCFATIKGQTYAEEETSLCQSLYVESSQSATDKYSDCLKNIRAANPSVTTLKACGQSGPGTALHGPDSEACFNALIKYPAAPASEVEACEHENPRASALDKAAFAQYVNRISACFEKRFKEFRAAPDTPGTDSKTGS